jgi:hypothetical protein
VTYRERQRLADIQAAIAAIGSHLQRGDLSDGLVFDAGAQLTAVTTARRNLSTERTYVTRPRSDPRGPWPAPRRPGR